MKKNDHSIISHLLWMALTLVICIGISAQIFIGASYFNSSANQKLFLVILSLGFFLSGIVYFYSRRLIQLKYFRYIEIPLAVAVAFGFSSFILLFFRYFFILKTLTNIILFLFILNLTNINIYFYGFFSVLELY